MLAGGQLYTTANTGVYSNHVTRDGTMIEDGAIEATAIYGAGTNIRAIGLLGRWTATDSYVLAVVQDNASAGNFNSMWIYEYASSANATSLAFNLAVALGTNPDLRLELAGDQVTLRVDVDRDGTFDQSLTGTTTRLGVGGIGVVGIGVGSHPLLDNVCSYAP
ncbi:MAG: hypothetical protein AB7L28_25900 [Kofleriaceae bacterium]